MTSLYDNGINPKTKGTGYGSEEKAKKTLQLIKKKPLTYQWQVVNTMYNRAKFHKYQTDGMRDAMEVYEKWIKKQKKSSKRSKRKSSR